MILFPMIGFADGEDIQIKPMERDNAADILDVN